MPDVLSRFSVLLFLLTSSRTLMSSLSTLSPTLRLQHKRSGLFLLLQSKSSTIIRSTLFLDPISFPLGALFTWSLLSLCLLANSSLTFSNTLLSVPFYLLAGAMELTLNESSDWGKKEYKKIKGKCRHAHAQSLSFPLCLVPYFRHHKLPATGYRFLLQHTTCCHLVLISR